MRNLCELPVRNREQLIWTVDCCNLRDHATRFCERVVVHHETAAYGASNLSAIGRNVASILSAVVVGYEIDGFAVRRKTRNRSHAIETKRQHFGGSARGRENRYVPRGIIKKAWLKLGDIRNPLAVGRPTGAGVRTRVCSDSDQVGALVGVSAATTQISELYVASGSGCERLLVKAMDLSSGDQAGLESSKSPEVTCVRVFAAKANT